MAPLARVWLVAGMLLVASTAAGAATGTSPWQVVARSHKWPTANGNPTILVKMPVGVALGQRHPQALAVRLLVRRQGRYVGGWLGYEVRCGGWRDYRSNIHVKKTPTTLQIPFRTWRARSCTISTGAYSSGGDDIRLQLLCRAKSRRECTPLPR